MSKPRPTHEASPLPAPTPGDPKDWQSSARLSSRPYVCGHCGQSISSDVGYFADPGGTDNSICWRIYICHHCLRPTFFGPDNVQVPGPLYGRNVEAIAPADVARLYNEARSCMGVSAYTGAALCCRKMLMSIAVSKGAEERKTFKSYVSFLADKKLIPEEALAWVDRLKDSGNEANHTIVLVEKRDAERLLKYVEQLLRLVYEFPAQLKED